MGNAGYPVLESRFSSGQHSGLLVHSGVAGDLLRFCVSVSAWLERLAETVEPDDVGVIVAGAGDSHFLPSRDQAKACTTAGSESKWVNSVCGAATSSCQANSAYRLGSCWRWLTT
mgnify:CR=1 FL=1